MMSVSGGASMKLHEKRAHCAGRILLKEHGNSSAEILFHGQETKPQQQHTMNHRTGLKRDLRSVFRERPSLSQFGALFAP